MNIRGFGHRMILTLALMAASLWFAPSALAHTHVGFGITIGVGNCWNCGYRAPPPMYYQPAYPAPVYYYPSPVYYAPRPVYYGYSYGYYAPSHHRRYYHRGYYPSHRGYYRHGHYRHGGSHHHRGGGYYHGGHR